MSYESALLALAEADRDIVVLTAENRAHIRGLPERLGSRFIDVGIAEQTLVGVAAGLALRGRKPIVHALAPFLTMRAFEFIRTDVGIGRLPVKLIGFVPGLLSDGNGPTHQSLEDIALMRGIPGMQVFCPEDIQELTAFLPQLIASPAPCYVRYTGRDARAPRPPASLHRNSVAVMARQINTLDQTTGKDREIRGPHPGGLRIPRSVQAGRGIGSADVRREGKDVTLLTYGLLVAEAELACDRLEERGISAGLINVRWLAPVDEAALLHAARTSALLVTIEDHFKVGGLYSILCELLVREGVTARVAPHALDGRWFKPGTLPRVLDHEGFSAAKLADRVLLAMQENT